MSSERRSSAMTVALTTSERVILLPLVVTMKTLFEQAVPRLADTQMKQKNEVLENLCHDSHEVFVPIGSVGVKAEVFVKGLLDQRTTLRIDNGGDNFLEKPLGKHLWSLSLASMSLCRSCILRPHLNY